MDGNTARAEWTAGTTRGAAIVSVLDDAGEPMDSWRFTEALPTVEISEPAND